MPVLFEVGYPLKQCLRGDQLVCWNRAGWARHTIDNKNNILHKKVTMERYNYLDLPYRLIRQNLQIYYPNLDK